MSEELDVHAKPIDPSARRPLLFDVQFCDGLRTSNGPGYGRIVRCPYSEYLRSPKVRSSAVDLGQPEVVSISHRLGAEVHPQRELVVILTDQVALQLVSLVSTVLRIEGVPARFVPCRRLASLDELPEVTNRQEAPELWVAERCIGQPVENREDRTAVFRLDRLERTAPLITAVHEQTIDECVDLSGLRKLADAAASDEP